MGDQRNVVAKMQIQAIFPRRSRVINKSRIKLTREQTNKKSETERKSIKTELKIFIQVRKLKKIMVIPQLKKNYELKS